MKNIFTKKITGALLLGYLLFAENVQAQGSTLPNCDGEKTLCNPIKAKNFNELLEKILDIVIKIGTIFVIMYVIYAGFLMIKAQGNPGEISKAKSSLFYALLGGLILLGAKAISLVLKNTVTNITG